MLFQTRWDALMQIYVTIGNGYDWHEGQIVSICGGEDRSEADFFRDLDECEARTSESLDTAFGDQMREFFERRVLQNKIARARRQFQLDNLDLLVFESPRSIGRFISMGSMRSFAKQYSLVMTIPDDAEKSFKDGALEVIDHIVSGLYFDAERDLDGGIRNALITVRKRLSPPISEEFLEKILAELRAETP
jgi:hypothetical protein